MANNEGFNLVFGFIKNIGTMMSVFMIVFVIILIIAVITVIFGFVFKYKEAKTLREATKIKAAAEVQQAAIRQEEKTLPMLLRAALGKMDSEQAAALVEQMHLNAQSSASQSVTSFQNATMTNEELDNFLNDLMSGLGQNVQADANANQQF